MTRLDVIDLDKIWKVNSMWQNKFFEPSGEVGLWFESYEKIKITKKIERKKNEND